MRHRIFAELLGVHLAVGLNVILGGFLGVLGGLNVVTVSQVCMVGGGFMVAILVMLGGFVVMARSVLVMFRCLDVVLCCYF
jgi:hypothetical protein